MDQAMLEQTDRDSVVRIRFYQWADPTISLGYFQRFGDCIDFLAGRSIDVVRRATGGGAIVHHFDWTYSIAMKGITDARRGSLGASNGLYHCVHLAVVNWLNHRLPNLRTPAGVWGNEPHSAASAGGEGCDQDPSGATVGCSFLCFNRRSNGDVIVGGHKLMGSAQRRHQATILQHGSLILAASPLAPHLPGLKEISDSEAVPPVREFAESIVQRISKLYDLQACEWDSEEPMIRVDESIRKRLESNSWIARI